MLIGMALNPDIQPRRISLTAKERTQHLFAVGKSGGGKSSFFRWMIRQDTYVGRGLILFDPHYDKEAGMGPLVREVLADIPYPREDDVIVLNLVDDEYPFALNLFGGAGLTGANAQTLFIDQIEQAFKKASGNSWGPQIEEWLTTIAHTFLENGQGTMADIPRLLSDGVFRQRFLGKLSPEIRQRWDEAVAAKTGEIPDIKIDSTRRRINKFLLKPTIMNIVKHEKTTLDFARWMAEGKIVLITIPPQQIGKEATQLIGTVLMQLILQAAFTRPIGATPFFVYADEFQHFVTPDIPDIIMNVRKHGVGLNLATQMLDNIEDDTVRKAVLAVGSVIIYEPTDADAALLARGLRAGPYIESDIWRSTQVSKQEIVARLANLRSVLGVGCAHCKLPSGEYSLRIPFPQDMDTPRVSVERIIARSRREYCHQVTAAAVPIAPTVAEPEDEVFMDAPPPRW